MKESNHKLWVWSGIGCLGLIVIFLAYSIIVSDDDEQALSVLGQGFSENPEYAGMDIKEMLLLNAKEVSYKDVTGDKYEEYVTQSFFKLTGIVGPIGEDAIGVNQQFTLTTEGDGEGVYLIQSDPPYVDEEMFVEEGEIITVYGVYVGKDEAKSIPSVFIDIIQR